MENFQLSIKAVIFLVSLLTLSSSLNAQILKYSTLEDAEILFSWLKEINLKDGINEEEAEIIGAMYWNQNHKNYSIFAGGASGYPIKADGGCFLPCLEGIDGEKSEHGTLINWNSGEIRHPNLKNDNAHRLLEHEIELVTKFISNERYQ